MIVFVLIIYFMSLQHKERKNIMSYLQQFYLFLLLSLTPCIFPEHKIVYLISPPRSLSTAFLRMIEAREDFTIINEPSIRINNKGYNLKFYDDTISTFDELKEKIFTESQVSNVFIKEISRSVKNFLTTDQDLPKKENIYVVILVRNPHHSLISFYKKLLQIPKGFYDLVNYNHTYEILKFIQKQYYNEPLIILSEDLYQNPEKTIEKFCNHVGLPYKQEALRWKNLGDDFTGIDEWHETKQKKQAYYWHGDAIKSSGFTTPSTYATDECGIPTFEEIINTKDREICKKAYYDNLIYYHLIINEIPTK